MFTMLTTFLSWLSLSVSRSQILPVHTGESEARWAAAKPSGGGSDCSRSWKTRHRAEGRGAFDRGRVSKGEWGGQIQR